MVGVELSRGAPGARRGNVAVALYLKSQIRHADSTITALLAASVISVRKYEAVSELACEAVGGELARGTNHVTLSSRKS